MLIDVIYLLLISLYIKANVRSILELLIAGDSSRDHIPQAPNRQSMSGGEKGRKRVKS